jgi:hypothetical protein
VTFSHRPLLFLLALAACSTAAVPPVEAQREQSPAPALAVAPLAGQRVPVLPVTLLSVEPPIDEQLPGDRAERLEWADRIVADVLMSRGPEVTWVLPPELRAVARRAPATVTDPDRMGHALMRASNLQVVPDPLRSYLRSLTAMTESRFVLIPAAVRMVPDSAGGIRAEAAMVLVDSRNGAVLWRSNPVAHAHSARAALAASIAHILPDIE